MNCRVKDNLPLTRLPSKVEYMYDCLTGSSVKCPPRKKLHSNDLSTYVTERGRQQCYGSDCFYLRYDQESSSECYLDSWNR